MTQTLPNLLEYLNIRTAPVGHHHRTEGWEQIDCVYCGEEDHFRMGVPLNSKTYCRCFACGAHSLPKTLALLSDKPVSLIYKLLKTVETDDTLPEIKLRGKLILPDGVGDLKKAHRKYLRERGFDHKKLVRLWGIQGIGQMPRLAWRLFIPIFLNQQMVSWTTRSLTDKGLRYINAKIEQEILSPKELLFGEDMCMHSVSVHEGQLDAMAMGPGAVATGGVGYSNQQLIRISRFSKRAICFDATPEGQSQAAKLASDLSVFPGETYNIIWSSGKDASRADEREREKLRRLLR